MRCAARIFCGVWLAALCLVASPARAETMWETITAFFSDPAPVVIYQGGGNQPWQAQYAIKIQEGTALLRQYSPLVSPNSMANEDALDLASSKLSEAEMQELMTAFEQGGYFKRANKAPESAHPTSTDGTYGMVYVVKDGAKYRLTADSETIPEFNAALFALQKLFPAYPLPVPRAEQKTTAAPMDATVSSSPVSAESAEPASPDHEESDVTPQADDMEGMDDPAQAPVSPSADSELDAAGELEQSGDAEITPAESNEAEPPVTEEPTDASKASE